MCGAVLQKAPIPILVLNPTKSGSLNIQGTPNIGIFGGASQSIQVNSNSSTAINLGGSAKIDLCYGGTTFCGANLGVYGNESIQSGFITSCPPATVPPNAPSCSATQVTPKWITPTSPILDPFAKVAAPTTTGMTIQAGPWQTILPGNTTNGCPDLARRCDDAGYCTWKADVDQVPRRCVGTIVTVEGRILAGTGLRAGATVKVSLCWIEPLVPSRAPLGIHEQVHCTSNARGIRRILGYLPMEPQIAHIHRECNNTQEKQSQGNQQKCHDLSGLW